jgi:hypothetical protein
MERGRPPQTPEEKQANTEKNRWKYEPVGNLLNDTNLTLREIAKKFGLTTQAIQQIQAKYFPDSPRRPNGTPKKDYSALDPVLLAKDLTIQEKAKKLNLSVARINQLWREAAQRNSVIVWSPETLKRQFQAMLRSAEYLWCYHCCQVKCLDEFSPYARERNGRFCTACNAEKQRELYRQSEAHREYTRRYRLEHPEIQARAGKRWAEKNREYVRQYRTLRQIRTDAPDIAEAVQSGAMSREEGISEFRLRRQAEAELKHQERAEAVLRRQGRARSFVYHRPTVEGFLAAAREHLTQAERSELLRGLEEEYSQSGRASVTHDMLNA